MGDRTLKINGTSITMTPGAINVMFPPPIEGYIYFEIGPGNADYASFTWYTR
jgi:hypothetical protein